MALHDGDPGQELLDFGLYGIALSRFSGCWVGLNVVTDVVEGGGSIRVGVDSPSIQLPDVENPPAGGLNIRAVDAPLPQRVVCISTSSRRR